MREIGRRKARQPQLLLLNPPLDQALALVSTARSERSA
jgi:hypothetical protein